MGILYFINYFIFSIFLLMFLLEVGLAILSLFFYKDNEDKFKGIINPIWEITGTFAVFYLVNLEVTYPNILPIIGNAYVLPLMIAAAFLLIRNIFLVFSDKLEQFGQRRFRLVYALSTLIIAVLVISALTSAISGIGLSTATDTISLGIFLNPFNIAMLVSLILISIFLAGSALGMRRISAASYICLVLGTALGLFAASAFLPNFIPSLERYYLIAAAGVGLLVLSIIGRNRIKHPAIMGLACVLIIINIFGILQYPYVFGSTNINVYTNSSVLQGPEIAITLIGGAIVAISLVLLVYINYLKKQL
jgi:cytochrome d ubiquinol oxidase subunit II